MWLGAGLTKYIHTWWINWDQIGRVQLPVILKTPRDSSGIFFGTEVGLKRTDTGKRRLHFNWQAQICVVSMQLLHQSHSLCVSGRDVADSELMTQQNRLAYFIHENILSIYTQMPNEFFYKNLRFVFLCRLRQEKHALQLQTAGGLSHIPVPEFKGKEGRRGSSWERASIHLCKKRA